MTLTMLVVVTALGGGSTALAEDGPAPFCAPTGVSPQVDGQCVDLGAAAEGEEVAEVQQPASGDPAPGFDSITGVFGGPFNEVDASPLRMSPSVTIGGGYLYVATGRSSAPYGMGVYMYSTGEGCPGNAAAPAGALCKVAQRSSTWKPDGIAYYKGNVYVSNTQHAQLRGGLGGRVEIFDARLDDYRWIRTPALRGIDVASGELWGRVTDFGSVPSWGVSLDYFAILDPQTGAIRGAVPVGVTPSPRVGDGSVTSPPSCEGGPGEKCFIYWNGPNFAMPKDVAISPELDVISSGDFSMHRTTSQALLAGDPVAWARLPLPDALVNAISGDPGCYNAGPFEVEKDSPVGGYAPWGMRWLIQIDSRCPGGTVSNPQYRTRVKESALSFEVDTGGVQAVVKRTAKRNWQPLDQTTEGPRDIAYQAHEPRITWSGRPTEDPWQHGTHTLTYFVSDGEFYTVAKDIERWFDPANGFQNVVLTAVDPDCPARPNCPTYTLGSSDQWMGTLTINEDTQLPSGTYELTMTAKIGGNKTVTKTNPNFRIDHDAPTGTLDGGLPAATKDPVAASGTLGDVHSGPGAWNLQVNGPGTGGNYQTVCTATAPDPGTGKWGCTWNTPAYPEGTYQVRALLADAVQPAYGGSNTTPVGNATVIVDRTPPTVDNMTPELLQDGGYSTVARQVTPVMWTQEDAGSGVGTTSIEVNTATDGSDSGAWQPIGSSGAAGTTGFSWDTAPYDGGLYRLRANSCDRAGNCRSYQWQTQLEPIRVPTTRCRRSDGVTRCYAGEDVWATPGGFSLTDGISARIVTPPPVRHTGRNDFSSAWVGSGGEFGANGHLQSGITTNRSYCHDVDIYINGVHHNRYHRRVEYVDPYGEAWWKCWGKTNEGASAVYNTDVLRGGARARALINGDVKYARVKGRKTYTFWLNRSGAAGTQVAGEVNKPGRQMGGTFIDVRYQPRNGAGYLSVGEDNAGPFQDTGYRFVATNFANFCVTDITRNLC